MRTVGGRLRELVGEITLRWTMAAVGTLLAVVAWPQGGLTQDAAPEQVIVTASARADARSVQPDMTAMPSMLTVVQALDANVPSAYLSDTESNLFQPDFFYRGFDASPVLGTAEGLAVYQNGDRINEAFGDTVLWDMVPLFAVSRIDVLPGSDPVLGLNALGGAVAVDMKTGFGFQGGEIDVTGGSYGRARIEGQFGSDSNNGAFYAGGMLMHDDGWRWESPSDIGQAYADYELRAGKIDAGASLTFAADRLSENAAVPVQDFVKAAFGIPDTTYDRVVFVQGHASYQASPALTLNTNIFVRVTHNETLNGEASGFSACSTNPATLCNDDAPLFTLGNMPVPTSAVGTGTLGVEHTDTVEAGFTGEADWNGSIGGMEDSAVGGIAFDDAPTEFGSSTYLGTLTLLPGSAIAAPGNIELGGADWNIRLRTMNTDLGVYAEDTLRIAPALSLEVAGRWNLTSVYLTDRYGTALTGDHQYSSINPSVKLTWDINDNISVHADGGASSRTPTAAELSCANPSVPCLFPLSFISDPNLREVTARTIDVGAKGKLALGSVTLNWLADAYDTRNSNDILFVSDGPFLASGFFTNVGATDRRGMDAQVKAAWESFDASVNYGFVDATFRTPFAEPSPDNPGANAAGIITIRPGNHLPDIPQNTANVSLGWQASSRLHLGIEMIAASSQYLRGDEANLQPPLPGYTVFDADANYRLSDVLALYVEGENIFDRRYATFGLYGDPTASGTFLQFTNPRFIVPAQPFGIWAGARAML
jgi:iron complex outermembrane recepter protein